MWNLGPPYTLHNMYVLAASTFKNLPEDDKSAASKNKKERFCDFHYFFHNINLFGLLC